MPSVLMETSGLPEMEAQILRVVHAEEGADLYDLARVVGTGPRTAQEAVRNLAQRDLVHVSNRGVQVRCTRAGNRWVRQNE